MTATGPRGWLTTVNPMVKILAVLPPLVLVLLTRDPVTPAMIAVLALVALVWGARPRPRTAAATVAVVLLVAAWTTVLFAAMTRADLVADSPVVLDGWITLRAEALRIGAATALRLVAATSLALLGSMGTRTQRLASALVHQCRVPYRFAYGTLAAARFAPRYRHDLATLRAAQRARGIIDPSGPVGYLRRTGRALVPLLAGGARHAERLSLAMDARGFGAHPRRTDRDPATVTGRDAVFVVAVWVGTAAVLVGCALAGVLDLTGSLHSVG